MELLQGWAERLVIPGLPEWSGLLVLLVAALVGLAYLLMPFSVFGLKGRLETLEAQIDELQAEIRTLALRLPEPPRRTPTEDYLDRPQPARRLERSPVAPAPVPPPAVLPEPRGFRAEPRVEWPGQGRQ